MLDYFNPSYPRMDDLRSKAGQPMPGFAFDYPESGYIDETGLEKNRRAIEGVELRSELLKRVQAAGYKVLMVTVDVPTFGYRPKDIRNGLAMPPRMTLTNVAQMMSSPVWLTKTFLASKPEMQTLKRYLPKEGPVPELTNFMDTMVMGRTDVKGLKQIRELWKGHLVIKDLVSEADVASAVKLGADGVVISNHGARQLDAGEAPVKPLQAIAGKYSGTIKIMMDSGLRSGSNIASALANGADFTLLGRPFVYGVGALGKKGAYHTINMLYRQLSQTMNQLRCQNAAELRSCLVRGK